MKRLLAMCLVTGSLTLASAAFGADAKTEPGVIDGMVKKAVNGAVNLVTGIVEWPMQTYKGYENGVGFISNKPTSKVVGTLIGFIWTGPSQSASRMVWGSTELFGFWTANRPDNEKIGTPFDGKYAWEMGTKYDVFKPTLVEGLMPIPRKLMCGVTDSFLGVVEVPGQIIKGAKDKEIAAGTCKGFWFWFSREWYGFSNIGGCLFSNNIDNPGYKEDGAWAWSGFSPDTEFMGKK